MTANKFERKLSDILPDGLKGNGIETVQVNVGRRCNLACKHCHLECSPDRTDMMSWPTMEKVVDIAKSSGCSLVDITGGAPELHPDFRRFVAALGDTGVAIQIRTNFVVLADDHDLARFLLAHKVRIVGSMPCYLEENVAAQRGADVYGSSIRAIRMLNGLGYGERDDLPLNLVYNPGGAFLPGSQEELEATYRKELAATAGIRFTRLFTIANMPIGRFGAELRAGDEMVGYMTLLEGAFNPEAVPNLMCCHQICVGWDGNLYDCDFNLALGLRIDHGAPSTVEGFDAQKLAGRRIVTDSHCFGCTAGAGSSCGGELA